MPQVLLPVQPILAVGCCCCYLLFVATVHDHLWLLFCCLCVKLLFALLALFVVVRNLGSGRAGTLDALTVLSVMGCELFLGTIELYNHLVQEM